MTRLLDRLSDETRALHDELSASGAALVAEITVASYRRYLTLWYGFVFPVERTLADVTALGRIHDPRRLRKHVLIAHDLQALGMKPFEVQALPQCMSVPLIEDLHDAIGWAYVIERCTLEHPNLYRQLAGAMPGEMAFASSYLKCYSGAVGEMWHSFGRAIEAAVTPEHGERVIEAARCGYLHFHRWRNTLAGESLSVVAPPLQPSRGRT